MDLPKAIYKCYTSHRPFGVEFETSASISKARISAVIRELCKHSVRISEWEQSINNPFWHVKQDSTCGVKAHLGKDYGWEIASYKGQGFEDISHISTVAQALSDAGLEVNNNCGLHIHADISDYRPTNAAVLLAYWVKIEPIMACMMPERRINNIHCKLWTKNPNVYAVGTNPSDFWRSLRPTNFSPHGNTHKKVSLNFVNFAYALHQEVHGSSFDRKTVELRMPEGTLNSADVRNWIMLFTHFVDACRKRKMPEDLNTVKDMSEFFNVLDLESKQNYYALSKGLLELKKWVLTRISKSDWANGTVKTAKILKVANDRLERLKMPA